MIRITAPCKAIQVTNSAVESLAIPSCAELDGTAPLLADMEALLLVGETGADLHTTTLLAVETECSGPKKQGAVFTTPGAIYILTTKTGHHHPLNGAYPVLNGNLTMPLAGCWYAWAWL
jgi:hypothetical protein